MTREEAKSILLLYRPNSSDGADPEIAEALALAKNDPELFEWLQLHNARQQSIQLAMRKITPPPGLKEQIISEHAAAQRSTPKRSKVLYGALVLMVLFAAIVKFELREPAEDNSLAVFQNRMVGVALRGYAMDLETNNLQAIRGYFSGNQAPSDFVLTKPLEHLALAGCAVETWQDTKVSMICFKKSSVDSSNIKSDLWLFVVDQSSVKGVPAIAAKVEQVNQLITASWVQNGKLYLLGTFGDEGTLKKLL